MSTDKDRKRVPTSKTEEPKIDVRDVKRQKTEEQSKPKLKEQDIFNLEIQLYKDRTTSDVAEFTETLATVKDTLTALRDLKSSKDTGSTLTERRVHASLAIARLRTLNRLSHIGCAAAKEATVELRSKSDQYHLRLQNLMYEVGHLHKEINKCLEFRSKDEELKLVSVEEFYRDAPSDISKPELTKDDSHEQRKARIQWEMEQRRILSAELSQVKSTIDATQVDIQKRQENLDSLGPKLTKILEATRPVQEYLGMPLETERVQYQLAQYLPQPLFVLYRNILSLGGQKSRRDALTVYIEGDVDAAKAFNASSNENDIESDSDQDEDAVVQSKHRRKTAESSVESTEAKLLALHPLRVRVQLAHIQPSNVTVNLLFTYMAQLEIVTVKGTINEDVSGTSVTTNDLLKADSILEFIIKDDRGKTNPNPATQSKMEQLNPPNISHFSSQVGRPYQWAQSVSGLRFLSSEQQEHGAVTVRSLTKRLRELVSARIELVHQLNELEKCHLNMPDVHTPVLPAKPPTTRLQQWTRMLYEDFAVLSNASTLIEHGVINPEWIVYAAKLACSAMRITAYVAISGDYPNTTPVLLINIDDPSLGSISRLNSDLILNLESEVNKDMRLFSKKNTSVLSLQLMKLCWLCDVIHDVGCHQRGEDTITSVKFLPNCYSGRSRKLPFTYNAKTGFFEH